MSGTRINIIVGCLLPPTERDKERFGYHYMESIGYKVHFFDLTKIFFPTSKSDGHLFLDAVQGNFISRIRSLEDFKAALDKISGNAIYCALEMGAVKTEAYYECLKQRGIPIYLASMGGWLPIDPQDSLNRLMWGGIVKNIMIKIGIAFRHPGKIYQYFSKKIVQRHVTMPDKIFVTCNKSYRSYVSLFGEIDGIKVPSHVNDFDLFIEAKNANAPATNTCVFLDENIGMSHDTQSQGKEGQWFSLKEYYASMNRFFDFVERKTGMSVVIAVSPRANSRESYREGSDIFGGRPLIKNRTAELVAQSSLVLLHASTSVNFAVLSDKPALIIIPQQLNSFKRSLLPTRCRAMAESLGQDVINIDSEDEINGIDFSNLKINEAMYRKYISDYISFNRSDERTFWQIVHDTIEQSGLTPKEKYQEVGS